MPPSRPVWERATTDGWPPVLTNSASFEYMHATGGQWARRTERPTVSALGLRQASVKSVARSPDWAPDANSPLNVCGRVSRVDVAAFLQGWGEVRAGVDVVVAVAVAGAPDQECSISCGCGVRNASISPQSVVRRR